MKYVGSEDFKSGSWHLRDLGEIETFSLFQQNLAENSEYLQNPLYQKLVGSMQNLLEPVPSMGILTYVKKALEREMFNRLPNGSSFILAGKHF